MRVVILTASKMKKEINGKTFSGKCITALDVAEYKVIRFVRNKLGAPVESPFCDRFHPLDVYDVDYIESCPITCQTENALVDYWRARYIGKYELGIEDIYERFQTIKYDDESFMQDWSYKMLDISLFKHSLEIVKVSNLRINIPENEKCSFQYQGRRYRYVSITDPDYKDTNQYIGDAFLVITIPADCFEDKGYFKFIASVFPIHPWSKEEDEDLAFEFRKGWQISIMAAAHKRTEEDIRSRLSFLRILPD